VLLLVAANTLHVHHTTPVDLVGFDLEEERGERRAGTRPHLERSTSGLWAVAAGKDGSRAGLNPKPSGFKPDGGGGGSNFSLAGLRVWGPDTVRGGGGSAISPAGDPRAPEV
jgi:hypothetical protein